jgi:hypothetical protein
MADNEKKHAACRECREKKLKCVPSEDGGDACHRCTRLGKDCQIPEIKLRKRKARCTVFRPFPPWRFLSAIC